MGFTVGLGGNASGTVYGTLRIIDGGVARAYITASYAGALNFVSGAKCYINNNFSTSSYPFVSSSATSVTGSIVFKSGSYLYDLGGVTPYPNSTTFPVSFETGSTLEIDGTLTTTALFAGRVLSNLVIGNGTTGVTVTAEGNPFNIDNLTINTGATLTFRTTGTYPVSGNIVNNGTLNCASGYTTTNLVLIGSSPQTVSGNSFSVAAICVGTDANVTLNTNVNIGSSSGTPTSSVTGKLNVGTNVITSTGVTTAGPFQLRSAASVTNSQASISTGSDTIKLASGIYASGVNTANVAIGCLVTGAGIPSNTYIVQTNSTSSYFLVSKPATQTISGNTATITITNYAATLATANTGGVDGSITTTGTKTFSTGANYIFNAATVTPFPTTAASITANNVTFNAAATLNKPLTVNGVLTLTAGTLNTDVNSLTLTASSASADFYPGTVLSVASGSTTNFNGNNVVLESSSKGTASIAAINGTLSGATNVTVQQFIPSGYRKFRLLGHPYTSALALSQLTDNIDITGTGGNANGFTATQTNNPSAFYFNTAAADGNGINDAGWNAFTDAVTANWNAGQGIRILVRGALSQSGSLDGSTYTPDSVVLDMNGTINQGNIAVNLVTGGSGATQGFNLVSNPYPSPVDIGSVVTAASNVVKTIYLRNPQTGSYTTQVISGAYTIPANTAFFIKATANTALSFSESNKSTCSSCAVVFGETDKNFIQFKAFNNNTEYDNFYVLFNNKAKEMYEPATDAVKLINDGLTLYTLSSDKQKLAADYRNALAVNSVIPVGIMLPASYGKQSYQIQVSDYLISGMKLSLHDKLTNSYTTIEKDAVYVLDIDPSNPLSIGENRLEIIVTQSSTTNLSVSGVVDNADVIVIKSGNTITVKYQSAQSVRTDISLLSSDGSIIQMHHLGLQQQGLLKMNNEHLASGIYLVEVLQGDKKTVKRINKL